MRTEVHAPVGSKLQKPSSKHQKSFKSQAPRRRRRGHNCDLELGISLGFGVWCLDFGGIGPFGELPSFIAWQRDLRRALQVNDQVEDFFRFQRFQKPLRHHRERRGLTGFDLVAREGDGAGLGLNGDGAFVFAQDNAAEETIVVGFEVGGAVLVPNDSVWIHNVLQEVLQVRALRAGQFRADPAALVEQGVAGGAGAIEQRPAARRMGGLERVGSE